MLTLTHTELSNIIQVLALIKDKNFPIKITYKIVKFIQDADAHQQTLQKMIEAIIKKYNGVPDLEKQVYTFGNDAVGMKAKEDIDEVQSIEVDIEFTPISLDSLPDSLELTPQQMIILSKLFTG